MGQQDRAIGAPAARPGLPDPGPSLFPLFLCLVLLIFGLLAYSQALVGPFLWDEYGIILDNAAKGAFEWKALPGLFAHRYFYIPGNPELLIHFPYYRPLTLLVHALTYHVFGLKPFWFHLESLLLHVGNSVLAFLLFSACLSGHVPGAGARAAALFGALLFFIHPRNVESVSIIANQTGLLCAFFSLLSLVCWARILVGGGRGIRVLYPVSLLALLLATFSKESGYVIPLVHALLFLVMRPRRGPGLPWPWLLSGYFLVAAVPLVVRSRFLAGPSIGRVFLKGLARQGSVVSYVGSALALLFHQLDQWFLPLDIRLFQYPFRPEDLSLREVLLPALVCILLFGVLRRERRLLALCAGLFLVPYLPYSNLVPIGRLPGGGIKAGAHHLYLPQAGLALLVASALFVPGTRRTPGRGGRGLAWARSKIPWLLATVVLGWCFHETFEFCGYFRTADRFYQGVLARTPIYSGAWQNYGWHKLYLEGDPAGAERILLEGLQVMASEKDDAGETKLVWNLLHLYLGEGRRDEAATLLQCVEGRWAREPVGNSYLWTMVERLAGAGGDGGGQPGGPPRAPMVQAQQ